MTIRITLTVLTAGLMQVHAQTPLAIDEYQVKAVFLFNFAKFVEWPATAFKSANEPIRICLLGQNPFVVQSLPEAAGIRAWLLDYPVAAGLRAIILGVSIGVIVVGLRIASGAERRYLG